MKKYYLNAINEGIINGFLLPVWIIYMQQNNLSFFLIGIVGALTEIVSLIFQIPLGVVADIYGKRRIVIFSKVITMIALMIFALSDNISFFMLFAIFLGIGTALYTGSFDGWFYEYLKNVKLEKRADKYFRILTVLYILGLGSASIVAGKIYEIYNKLPFFLAVGFSMFNVFIIMSIQFDRKGENAFSNTFKLIDNLVVPLRRGFWICIGIKDIMIFTIVMGLVEFGFDGIERYYQIVLQKKNISLFGISNVYTCISIISIMILLLQNKIIKNDDNQRISIGLGMLGIVLGASFMLFTDSWISYLMVVVSLGSHEIIGPAKITYLNSKLEDDIRATGLSIFEFTVSIFETFSGIIVGGICDLYGLQNSIIICSFIIVIAIIIFYSRKVK